MAPKDLIQSMKDNLEREAEFDDKPTSVNIQYCDEIAKAIVHRLIDGKWVSFEVWARPLGESEGIKI